MYFAGTNTVLLRTVGLYSWKIKTNSSKASTLIPKVINISHLSVPKYYARQFLKP
jgi:hypothetical protein